MTSPTVDSIFIMTDDKHEKLVYGKETKDIRRELLQMLPFLKIYTDLKAAHLIN